MSRTSASTASPTWSVRWLSRVRPSARPTLPISSRRVSETVKPGAFAAGRLRAAPAVFSVLSAAWYEGAATPLPLRTVSSPILGAPFLETAGPPSRAHTSFFI